MKTHIVHYTEHHGICRLLLLFLMIMASIHMVHAEEYPAHCRVKTNLRVRSGAGTNYRKLGLLYRGSMVVVESTQYSNYRHWGMISYGNQTGYIAIQYVDYVEPVQVVSQPKPVQSPDSSKHFNFDSIKKQWWLILVYVIIGLIVVTLLRAIALGILSMLGKLMYKLYWFLCFPFYCMNWLQRYLSKPWRPFYKTNSGNDRENQRLHTFYEFVKMPLYLLLTPLRLVNAIYYNTVHCCFVFYNYIIEALLPANSKEGADNYFLMLVLIPWRIIRYLLFHGLLTIIESIIWTIVDTIVPALTLYHGTNCYASVSITKSGRCGDTDYYTVIWNVGTGNYAGNGIYFASERSTAIHYSRGALIVCRVSLGKVLDLGLAPHYVYKQCGYPDALGATDWGLRHGYTTGEWWRGDARWWEYCMYDWQKRYNFSWRIRPLYVLDMDEQCVQRIPGGMSHWLFRRMVIKDIFDSISKSI